MGKYWVWSSEGGGWQPMMAKILMERLKRAGEIGVQETEHMVWKRRPDRYKYLQSQWQM